MALDRIQRLLRLEPGRPAIALGVRGAIATFLPLVGATLAGHAASGLWMGMGGLNTLLADVGGPYRTRATAMGAALVGGAASMLVGTLVGGLLWLAVPLVFLWSLACGLAGAYGSTAAVAGLVVNFVFVVALGLGGGLADGVQRALGFLAGGAFGMLFSLLLWPLHPYQPVREAVAGAYRAVAAFLAAACLPGRAPGGDDLEPGLPASRDRAAVEQALDTARQAVGAIRASAHGASPTDVSLLLLVRAAERTFLAAVALAKVLDAAAGVPAFRRAQSPIRAAIGELAETLRALAETIARGGGSVELSGVERALGALDEAARELRAPSADPAAAHAAALVDDAIEAVETIAGHVRAAAHTARQLRSGQIQPAGGQAPARADEALSRRLAALTAQLTFRSVAFRHALRLGVAAAAGVVVYTLLGLPHGYWVTLTVVAILRSNVGGTLALTVQRVGGTVLGATVAAILIAAVRDFAALVLVFALVTAACFAVRSLSYVLFVAFLTPLVVFLVDLSTPGDWTTAGVRILNTLIGGLLAVLASYLLWPAWERDRLPPQLAATLRANRDYFRCVAAAYLGRLSDTAAISDARRRAELENGNSAASFQRLLSEPRSRRGPVEPLYELMTYNQQLCDAITTLEMHVPHYSGRHELPGLAVFARQIEDGLGELADAVESDRRPVSLPPFDATLDKMRAHVQALEATRARELAANQTETPTQEAVADFTRLSTQLDRVAREVGGMQLSLSRM